jgi:hypothetical protein
MKLLVIEVADFLVGTDLLSSMSKFFDYEEQPKQNINPSSTE